MQINPLETNRSPQVLTAMQARKQFGDILNRAAYQGRSVIIERAGKALIAILPIDNYQKLVEQDKLNRQAILQTMETLQKQFTDMSEVEQDRLIDETIAEVRREARSK